MKHLLAPIAVLLSSSLGAAEMVSIGSEKKFAQGLLRGAESGDVACYLVFEDESGEPFTELAEFALCDEAPNLIGRELRLTYTTGQVLADSCQGDPDCKDTSNVVLVKALKPVAKKEAGAYGPSHCQSKEYEVFGCTIDGGKLVNVCADRAGMPKSLQYRFGKRDSAELKLPAQASFPNKTIYGRNEPFAGGGGAWLRFRNGAYGYVVYTGIGSWGPNGETETKSGVTVEKNGAQIANLPCIDTVRSELGPDWFDAIGVDRDRKDEFLFPE